MRQTRHVGVNRVTWVAEVKELFEAGEVKWGEYVGVDQTSFVVLLAKKTRAWLEAEARRPPLANSKERLCVGVAPRLAKRGIVYESGILRQEA